MRRFITFCMFVCLILGLFSPRPAFAQGGDEGWLLAQVNALRGQNGLGVLAWNGQLAAAAAGHSQYLASSAYVGPHVQANGSTPQTRAAAQGYGGRVGENVVGGGTATLNWAWSWWMNSATHRNNMLGNWNEIGIAVAEGSYGRWYTMVFGDSGGGSAPPAINPPPTDSMNATGGGAPAVQPPRRTAPPRPTNTPTITLTPSMTFTPRASFTPLPTITFRPASATPIVMEVVPPNATEKPQPPTTTPTPSIMAPAVAIVATIGIAEATPAVSGAAAPASPMSNDTLRTLLPVFMVAQLVLIVGLAIRAALRRRPR
jgi:hypothetical protein